MLETLYHIYQYINHIK